MTAGIVVGIVGELPPPGDVDVQPDARKPAMSKAVKIPVMITSALIKNPMVEINPLSYYKFF